VGDNFKLFLIFWYLQHQCRLSDVNIALERTLKLKFKTTVSSSPSILTKKFFSARQLGEGLAPLGPPCLRQCGYYWQPTGTEVHQCHGWWPLGSRSFCRNHGRTAAEDVHGDHAAVCRRRTCDTRRRKTRWRRRHTAYALKSSGPNRDVARRAVAPSLSNVRAAIPRQPRPNFGFKLHYLYGNYCKKNLTV